MNKKPILITAGILLLALCSFLFIRSRYLVKPEKKEVIAFLDQFNADLKQGFTDTLLNYFDGKQNSKQLLKLLGALSNKKSLNGRDIAFFDVNLISDASQIKNINSELTEATVPVEFKEKGANLKQTVLIIKLRKVSAGKFKIMQIDARKFVSDFMAYENRIRMRGKKIEDIFSPLTLAAFKTAETLKARYDSVLWFQHLEGKSFFYVVKGKWEGIYYTPELDGAKTVSYKMGLLNPELKEIIPPDYDLIHNIGGTIDGLVEVEKDKKKGLYDLTGKIIVPVKFDQILPLNDEDNIALLNSSDGSYYLKKDMTLSERVTDVKIADVFTRIKGYGHSFTVDENTAKNVMEFNDKEFYTQLIVSPSYLTDWNILPQYMELPNHLRKPIENESGEDEGSLWYEINFDGHRTDENNWFETAYYSVVNNYLGSRAGLYESKSVLMLDKKLNRILSLEVQTYFGLGEGGGKLSGQCNDNSFRQVNDTLFEYKTTSELDQILLNNDTVSEGPYYHYLHIKDGKLKPLENQRLFGFTKYVKMDDSYIHGCYLVNSKVVDHVTAEMLQYAKNEIFAQYQYKFKNPKWVEVFSSRFYNYEGGKNANVDDSLTAIDKYNINWINNKLKVVKQPKVLAAAK